MQIKDNKVMFQPLCRTCLGICWDCYKMKTAKDSEEQ